jgi:hypothetical protein
MSDFIRKIKSNRGGYVIAVWGAIAGPLLMMLTVHSVANTGQYIAGGLALGVAFSVMAPIFALFPGSPRRIIDYPDEKLKLSILWAEATLAERIAWIMCIGLCVYLYVTVEDWIWVLVAWWK